MPMGKKADEFYIVSGHVEVVKNGDWYRNGSHRDRLSRVLCPLFFTMPM